MFYNQYNTVFESVFNKVLCNLHFVQKKTFILQSINVCGNDMMPVHKCFPLRKTRTENLNVVE